MEAAGRAAGSGGFRDPAFMANRQTPVHRWVPWIAGFSRDFVQDSLARFLETPGVVLDPFAGVGTTLIEADLAGHHAMGFEINPYAAFAARAKLGAHRQEPARLRAAVDEFVAFMAEGERSGHAPKASAPAAFRTRAPFYSPAVERKVLLAIDFIETQEVPIAALFRLAFAATMVGYSNYSYEPSLGRKASVGRPEVNDSDVAGVIAGKLRQMADDAAWYRAARTNPEREDGRVVEKSFFEGYAALEAGSVDLLVTSPPYLNNYHYNRNTRPHLYWLGFCSSPRDLKRLEDLNVGTYWQNARDGRASTSTPPSTTAPYTTALDGCGGGTPTRASMAATAGPTTRRAISTTAPASSTVPRGACGRGRRRWWSSATPSCRGCRSRPTASSPPSPRPAASRWRASTFHGRRGSAAA